MQILKSATSQSFTARQRDANCREKIELHFTATKIENASLFTLLIGSCSYFPKLQREEKVYSKSFHLIRCSRNS